MPTFAALKTEAAAKLLDPNNTAVSAANVGAAINEAITYWSKKRFWFSEQTDTTTLVTGSAAIPNLPTDFDVEVPEGGFVINYADQRYTLRKITMTEYDNINLEGLGLPFVYAWEAGNAYVYYYPDQDYTVEVRYLKLYTALSADSDTNDFTNYADRLILYDALSRLHAEYRQDEKMEAYYSARAKDEYDNLKLRSFRNLGVGRLQVDTIIQQY